MRCAECSTSNPLDHKHCKECGARLDDGYRMLLREARAAQVPAEDAKAERLTQLLDMAFWHNEAGHLDAAMKACEAALSLHAENTTAHSLLGTLYEKKGDDAAAIRHFQTVVTLNPDSVADAQKLDQLTRGVHVRAVAPPPVQRWIPPALASLTLSRLSQPAADGENASPRKLPRWVPLAGASCAVALVLGAGFSMIHGGAGRPAPEPEVRTNTLISPPPHSAHLMQRGVASQSQQNAAPVTMKPGSAQGTALADLVPPPPYAQTPAKVPPDPFAGQIPASAFAATVPPHLVRVPRTARVPGGARVSALPPLSLRAVPLPGEGVAPAPVDVPVGINPTMPQHTVVVSSLGQQNNALPTSASSPHIHITVNKAGDGDGPIVLSNVPGQSDDPAPQDAAPDASRLQQSALSAQQSGSYKEARSWYQQAIRAYRAQIAAGRDVDTARAGLSACQTGLAICQQQPL